MSHTKIELTWQADGEIWHNEGCGGQLGRIDDPEFARHIVACVNACRHLTTEQLEAGIVHDLKSCVDRMAVQHTTDEMVENGETQEEAEDADYEGAYHYMIEDARSVLAKINGGQG